MKRDGSAASDAGRRPFPQDAELSPGTLTPDQIAEVERLAGLNNDRCDDDQHSGRRIRSSSTRSGRTSETRSSLQGSRSSSSSRPRKSSSVPRKKSHRQAPERGQLRGDDDLDDLAARIVSEELDRTRRRGRSCGRVGPGSSEGGEGGGGRSRGLSGPRRRDRPAHGERSDGIVSSTNEHAGGGRGRGPVPASSRSLHSEAKELLLAGGESSMPSRSKSDSTAPTDTSDMSSGEDNPRGRRASKEKKPSRWSVRSLVGRRRSSDDT